MAKLSKREAAAKKVGGKLNYSTGKISVPAKKATSTYKAPTSNGWSGSASSDEETAQLRSGVTPQGQNYGPAFQDSYITDYVKTARINDSNRAKASKAKSSYKLSNSGFVDTTNPLSVASDNYVKANPSARISTEPKSSGIKNFFSEIGKGQAMRGAGQGYSERPEPERIANQRAVLGGLTGANIATADEGVASSSEPDGDYGDHYVVGGIRYETKSNLSDIFGDGSIINSTNASGDGAIFEGPNQNSSRPKATPTDERNYEEDVDNENEMNAGDYNNKQLTDYLNAVSRGTKEYALGGDDQIYEQDNTPVQQDNMGTVPKSYGSGAYGNGAGVSSMGMDPETAAYIKQMRKSAGGDFGMKDAKKQIENLLNQLNLQYSESERTGKKELDEGLMQNLLGLGGRFNQANTGDSEQRMQYEQLARSENQNSLAEFLAKLSSSKAQDVLGVKNKGLDLFSQINDKKRQAQQSLLNIIQKAKERKEDQALAWYRARKGGSSNSYNYGNQLSPDEELLKEWEDA